MSHGSDFDRVVEQRIFSERNWIDAQPGLVAQGRAVCLFGAQEFSPDYLVELVDRFYRVFVFITPDAKAEWMQETSRAGHRVYPFHLLVGREENLEICRRLALEEEPRLRGASIIHLTDQSDPKHLPRVQDLYAAAGMIPQPKYFVAGSDNTVLTSLLMDEDGLPIGTTMYHHLVRVGPGFGSVACGLNAAIRPRRTRAVRPPAERNRSLSLAAWLNASAILHCRERFGVREIWSYPRVNNRRAVAFHQELGASESESVGCFCAEHRMALPDRRYSGNTASFSESASANP